MAKFSAHIIAQYLIKKFGINQAKLISEMEEHYSPDVYYRNTTKSGKVNAITIKPGKHAKRIKNPLKKSKKKTGKKKIPFIAKANNPLTIHELPPVTYRKKRILQK